VTIHTVETHPEFRKLKDKSQLLNLMSKENSDLRNELDLTDRVLRMLSAATFSLDEFEANRKPNVQLMTPEERTAGARCMDQPYHCSYY
jgi:hypothetical protein